MTPFRRDVGERIRTRRKELGLKQHEAGATAGIGQPQWSSFESGRSAISLEQAMAVSAALGVSVSWLAGEAEAPTGAGLDPMAGLLWEAIQAQDMPRLFSLLSLHLPGPSGK